MQSTSSAPGAEPSFLRDLLESLNLGHYRSDEHGRVIEANAAALQMLGFDQGDLERGLFALELDWDERDGKRVRLQAEAEGLAGPLTMRLRDARGKPLFIEISLRRWTSPGGDRWGLEGLFKDVTGEVALFREQQAQTYAAKASLDHLAAFGHLQEDLLFSLSHDLKTPPVVIQGFSELLLRGRYGALTPEQEKPLQTVYRNVLALSAMVDQLLDFSRLLRQIHGESSNLSLSSAWTEACDGFGETGHALAILKPCTVSGSDRVRTDATGLAYALRTIAINILRVAKPGTDVESRVEPAAAGTGLTVLIPSLLDDHLPPSRLSESMFHPASPAHEEAGLVGPGLAASRYLAVALGGDLTCDDWGEGGMRIEFRLPAG